MLVKAMMIGIPRPSPIPSPRRTLELAFAEASVAEGDAEPEARVEFVPTIMKSLLRELHVSQSLSFGLNNLICIGTSFEKPAIVSAFHDMFRTEVSVTFAAPLVSADAIFVLGLDLLWRFLNAFAPSSSGPCHTCSVNVEKVQVHCRGTLSPTLKVKEDSPSPAGGKTSLTASCAYAAGICTKIRRSIAVAMLNRGDMASQENGRPDGNEMTHIASEKWTYV